MRFGAGPNVGLGRADADFCFQISARASASGAFFALARVLEGLRDRSGPEPKSEPFRLPALHAREWKSEGRCI